MTPPAKKRPLFDWAFLVVASISAISAAYVFYMEGRSVSLDILTEDLMLFATILPKVAAGCLIGALVRLLVPREVIVRWVGEGSGLRGLLIAAFVGALFPGGPFTIFPLAGAFMLIGADKGAAVAFVTGWLLLGINRAIIWELPFFGHDIVLMRMGISLLIPVAAGLMARWLDRLLPEWKSES